MLQLVALVAPRVENMPRGVTKQPVSFPSPGNGENLPAAHKRSVLLPSGHQAPAPHSAQPVSPSSDWNLPGSHKVQLPLPEKG